MAKIIVYAATICAALPVEGAKIYINGTFCGVTGEGGYSDILTSEGNSCSVSVIADGYEECFSDNIKLYENTTVVWSAMLEKIKVKQSQKNSKKLDFTVINQNKRP